MWYRNCLNEQEALTPLILGAPITHAIPEQAGNVPAVNIGTRALVTRTVQVNLVTGVRYFATLPVLF